MKLCIWDTETTWLPVGGGRLDQQPYIVQFAAIVGEISPDGSTYTEISRHDIYIRPYISIPFGASQVNGIYDRDVENAGHMDIHIDQILGILNTADIVGGHNIEYDEWVLRYELERLGRKWEYAPMKSVCTMRLSTEYCQLVGRGFGYKTPKLSELHKKLFGEWFEWAHNAIVDVEATMRCAVELVRRGVIPLVESNEMRLF